MEVALVACLLTSAVFLAIGLEQKYSRRHLFLIAVLLCAMVVTRRDAAVLHVVVSTYVVWASRSARSDGSSNRSDHLACGGAGWTGALQPLVLW